MVYGIAGISGRCAIVVHRYKLLVLDIVCKLLVPSLTVWETESAYGIKISSLFFNCFLNTRHVLECWENGSVFRPALVITRYYTVAEWIIMYNIQLTQQ